MCPAGDLKTLVDSLEDWVNKPEVLKFYIIEAVLVLEHLHDNDILSNDFKLENVLIDETGHIKLSDFGLSTPDSRVNNSGSIIGSNFEYLCPEMLLEDEAARVKNYSRLSDLYHLGCFIYELFFS